MKSDNLPLSLLAALVMGIAQMFLLIYFWAGMTLYVQHVPWLISLGIVGTPLKSLLFVFDNLTNLVLCLPAAIAIINLRPRKLPLYLLIAVLPGFLWQYRLFPTDTWMQQHWTLFLSGALSAALTLPAAVLLARHLAARRAV